ncbi:hypothetical protein AAZX31_15G058400 [Glycine max]|uniref:Cysteine-rich transmembrane domain-containing protein n=3 Tax=Glycine subgen. Soja TaxID=1462606 RepID=K7M9W2_SOYBN|nr:uncharacterized protein PGYRP7 isoform X1 [Glycine max]KAG4945460.1 hypothetical protein JHK87_041467 [Glycine soja]KAG4948335.1 hypothetical protein JHK86_041574 [Glycine max]KAG4955803.1 hypothetical protein JHK85_042183 [Glycine max]KAG5104546.1 hypothetical protein JHK82_041516 [Glycine max]KAG5115673.1 hypothetical protein JHK84_041786 [Glycine max]|eukprot:XP_003545750.2 uncharacterized protein PGYRP7 isoform X1 [Glycine max]
MKCYFWIFLLNSLHQLYTLPAFYCVYINIRQTLVFQPKYKFCLPRNIFWVYLVFAKGVLVEMSEIKYGYPYPAQGTYQGPPPVAAPPQYYAAPPPRREPGFLEGCLAALCCCCLLDECCCDPTIVFAS